MPSSDPDVDAAFEVYKKDKNKALQMLRTSKRMGLQESRQVMEAMALEDIREAATAVAKTIPRDESAAIQETVEELLPFDEWTQAFLQLKRDIKIPDTPSIGGDHAKETLLDCVEIVQALNAIISRGHNPSRALHEFFSKILPQCRDKVSGEYLGLNHQEWVMSSTEEMRTHLKTNSLKDDLLSLL